MMPKSLMAAGLAAALIGGVMAPAMAQAPQGMPVEAMPVRAERVVDDLMVVGSLLANETTVIRPEIDGRVAAISFEEGGMARKGDLLVRLDDASRRAELAKAEANLALSRRNFDRADELYRRQNLPASSRDEALAKLRADEASLRLTQVALEKTELHAPFDGMLGLRKVSTGDYLQPGTAIVTLDDVDPIKVDFRVPEVFAHRLRTGQTIQLTVDAVPGRTFEGEVYAIDPQVDVNGRSVLLRARVPNQDGPLRPGMFVRVTLLLDERPNALVIPEEALIPQGDSHIVFKVVNGTVEPAPVALGIRRKGMVEITSGLLEGDMVITAGQLKVRPGMPVMVMPPPAEPQNAAAPAQEG